MGGAPNTCSGFNSSGIYQAGQIILAGVNYVVANVNVTSIGTYQIRTTPVNGVTFSTGATLNTFTSLGVQSVILFASGTPIASGNFNYILNSPNTNCRFTITYL